MTDYQYAGTGVDLREAEAAKQQIGRLVSGTATSLTLGAVGAFGGMVRVPPGMHSPVLVMSTDGVGTKVLVAQQAGRYDSIGEDLVNHSVNDILVHGASPLAFMDYIAGHRMPVAMITGIVEGIARACRRHGMVLAGGETAQMPGLYAASTFDLAGTIIGVVEESAAIHGDEIQSGDLLLGYAASGLHTNGYSLARHVLLDILQLQLDDHVPGTETSLIDALLVVHQSYYDALWPVLDQVHGLAHITGGGVADNLVRVLPVGVEAVIDPASWQWPELFRAIEVGGGVSLAEMRAVFNLGIGMVAVVPAEAVELVQRQASEVGIPTSLIGEIRPGDRQVRFAD